jgi:amino acid efflux transporter
MSGPGRLGVIHGASLYVGALIGPGLLLVPSLAAQAAGPASVLAWAGLVALSALLALTFAALGARHPVAGGVVVYVAEGLGSGAAATAGVCFLTAVLIGAPAVALIGGYYFADLTNAGTGTAVTVGAVIFALALIANVAGVRVAARAQLALMTVLVTVVALAIAVTVPGHLTEHWQPFAPHGWWSIGTAASILIWLFVGWEAVAQHAADFRDPQRNLPRAVAASFAIVTVLYLGLAIATVVVPSARHSRVPLADLLGVGFGSAGRGVTVVLAIALTLGTMNVYVGAAAKLAGALARERTLPAWVGKGSADVPRLPLLLLAVVGSLELAVLAAGVASPATLVRATSACFVIVYVLALASGTRTLSGAPRTAAGSALLLMIVVAGFSAQFLLVPAIAAGIAAVGVRRRERARSARAHSDLSDSAADCLSAVEAPP